MRTALVAAMLIMVGCESMPVQEMSDARQAIAAAEDAGAAEHATEQFQAALGYLESAEKYLTSQNYAIARRDAVQAKAKAIEALQLAEASRSTED